MRTVTTVASLLASMGMAGCGDDASVAEQAQARIEAGAVLLDVRTPEEYSGGHIDGAVNIPLASLGSRVGEIDTSQGVVVYCAAGGRSARAASMLRQQGVDVYDLGAMSNWRR